MNKNEIRRLARQARNQLPIQIRQAAEAQIISNLLNSSSLKSSENIASFFPNDGEPDLTPLFYQLLNLEKNCFFPVLNKKEKGTLNFSMMNKNTPTKLNEFGIPEPISVDQKIINIHSLNLVLMPLVAFDDWGNRVGMGGGFYDKTFKRMKSNKPLLCGIAFEIQKVRQIPSESHDIKPDIIVTEKTIYSFNDK